MYDSCSSQDLHKLQYSSMTSKKTQIQMEMAELYHVS